MESTGLVGMEVQPIADSAGKGSGFTSDPRGLPGKPDPGPAGPASQGWIPAEEQDYSGGSSKESSWIVADDPGAAMSPETSALEPAQADSQILGYTQVETQIQG